ncbi:ATP-binding protein [candidate division KSB1 bacterium]|nr:ATP-binding protein [candidate division KSB1 bacterium]
MKEYINSFHPQIGFLEPLREWFISIFKKEDIKGEQITKNILLAVTEIFVNFVKHSTLRKDDLIQIIIRISPGLAAIYFMEYGERFDVTSLENPDLSVLSESGYGIFIVKTLMDSFEYTPKANDEKPNITKITKGYYLWQKKKF